MQVVAFLLIAITCQHVVVLHQIVAGFRLRSKSRKGKSRGVLQVDEQWLSDFADEFAKANAKTTPNDVGYAVQQLQNILREDELGQLLYDFKIQKSCLMETPGMTLDMANAVVALHSYTLEIDSIMQCRPLQIFAHVSHVVHIAHAKCKETVGPCCKAIRKLRELCKPDQFQQAMPWINMIDKSLTEFPGYFLKGKIGFRGMRYHYTDEQFQKFAEGNVICWYSFKSVSTDKNVMKTFCGEKLEGTIFVIKDLEGTSIKNFSQRPNEEEVLIRPLTFFQVLRAERGTMQQHGDPWKNADKIYLKMLTIDPPRSREQALKALGEAYTKAKESLQKEEANWKPVGGWLDSLCSWLPLNTKR